MPVAVVPVDALALGPGYLYYAALATAQPTHTVAGSVFSDSPAGTYLLLGATENGNEFSYDLSVDEVMVEEYLDPVTYTTTSRKVGMKFELAQIHATNWKRAMNGGTITVTGSGVTTMSSFTPPALGAEVRCVLFWESTDQTERLWAPQAFQVGSIAVKRQKGAAKATIPTEWRFEQPAAGFPYTYITAGTKRA